MVQVRRAEVSILVLVGAETFALSEAPHPFASTAPRRIIRGVPQTPPQTPPLVAESKMGEARRHIIQRIPSQREVTDPGCGGTGPVASHSDSINDFSFAGMGQSSSERFIILTPPQKSANARTSAAETVRTGIQLTVTAQIGVSTRPKASANSAKYLWWDAGVFRGRAVILPTQQTTRSQCQSYLNRSNPSIRLLTL